MRKSNLKPSWVKTKIPKPTKIKLWEIMKDAVSYEDWQEGVANAEFDKKEDKYVRMSRYTYDELRDEIREMPIDEVKKLPDRLQTWILQVRKEKDLKEQGQVVTEPPSKESSQDTRLTEHFHKVAETAKLLASNIEKLLYYKSCGSTAFRGDIVKGFRSYWGSPEDAKVIEIEEYLARCVFVHYEHKFGKLPYDYWEEVTKENVSQELADNLVRLANSKAFKPCPKCPVCVELAGLKPVSEGSFPYYDEKTGKVTYVPPDF